MSPFYTTKKHQKTFELFVNFLLKTLTINGLTLAKSELFDDVIIIKSHDLAKSTSARTTVIKRIQQEVSFQLIPI